MDTFVFLINSRSGRSQNEELERVIQQKMSALAKRYFVKANCYITQSEQHTQDLIHSHLAKGDTYFIAVGGDGTVNTVAKELVHSSGALGIIPRGSGNGLARHLKMPQNIQYALNRLCKKRVQLSDALQINGQWSFNVAGLGFDGHISTLFGQNGKRGMRNYIKLINAEYQSYKPVDMIIQYGNTKLQKKIFQLAIANASQYGNNAIVAPKASINDQLLNIGMIEKVPVALLPAFFLKVFSGNIESSKYVKSFITDSLQVITERPVHFHTDGDGRGLAANFDIKIIPNCLNIIY